MNTKSSSNVVRGYSVKDSTGRKHVSDFGNLSDAESYVKVNTHYPFKLVIAPFTTPHGCDAVCRCNYRNNREDVE